MTERLFSRAYLISLLMAVGVIAYAASFAIGVDLANVDSRMVTALLIAAQDGPVAAAFVAVFVGSLILARRWGGVSLPPVPLIAVAVLMTTVAIRFWAFHDYDMSLDEFIPTFQAAIFSEGDLIAPAPEGVLARRMQPVFLYHDSEAVLWMSGYRPVHAALLALSGAFGAASFLNPVMAVISIFAMADIARRTFPDMLEAAVVAAGLLAISPQFLVTGGSGFAFAAHLTFNLVWLSLFLRERFWAHCLAAVIGFLAVGLHQIHFHPLFAAPFLIALLFGKFGNRWALVPYALAYTTALVVFVTWAELSVWWQTGDASVLPGSLRQIEYLRNYLEFTDSGALATDFDRIAIIPNVLRYLMWMSPVMLVLFVAGLSQVRGNLVVALALVGVVLTVLLNHIAMPNQLHGWGTRYYHPVYGSAVLIAMAGYARFRTSPRKGVLAAMAALSLLILPWRAWQVHQKIGPRAAVQQQLFAMDADWVVINIEDGWYPLDFIRNDPYQRNRPKMAFAVSSAPMPPEITGDVRVLDHDDLIALGLPQGTFLEPRRATE